MKSLRLIAIAITAAVVAGPAYAGRDEVDRIVLERAAKRAAAEKALAGPTGPQGQAGPSTSRGTVNIGHPTERIRR